ncbi:MAG: CaiB/BaiF CoA transferase family protein [Halolamina sp.]
MVSDDSTRDSDGAGPLDGLRVVSFAGMISGGFAAAQLADFGADVVKVEHPDHDDPIREWPPYEDGVSLWWKSLGRNARCVTLDLNDEDGRHLALDLVGGADVVLENFRPGTLERWDLGPETLMTANPEVVVVRLSGYGQTGPRSDEPGFGTVAEGLSGWAQVNGFPDSEPLLPPISLADLTAAQFAVHGAMFALYERELSNGGSGEGQVVDVSLFEPLFRLFVGDVEAHDRLGKVPERTGNRHPNAAPRNVYETADGHVTLSASSQSIFENVLDAIGRPELADEPRFETNEKRVEHAAELDAMIEAWTCERSTDTVITEMKAADAIVGPVYDMADIRDDDHYRAREAIVEMDDEELGSVETQGPVPTFSRTPGTVDHAGPAKGKHNETVYLEELGLDAAEYERLREEGVI